MTKLKLLKTTDEVIAAFESREELAALTGRDPHSVFNWRSIESGGRGKFPSDTAIPMLEHLRQKGCTAPLALWGIPTAPVKRAKKAKVRRPFPVSRKIDAARTGDAA